MIAQTTEKPAFSAEQIAAAIAAHNIQPTSQFTAEQIAVKCLEASLKQRVQVYVNPRTASRRHMRGYSYGDCHWGGK